MLRRPADPVEPAAASPVGVPAAAPGRDEAAARTPGHFVSAGRVAVPRATQGAPALSVHNLGKRFGDRIAFQDVSFEIGYGEVFGFLGPNGAGKTTTVRTLGTLIAPTSGSATVAGIPAHARERSRDPPPDLDHARVARASTCA